MITLQQALKLRPGNELHYGECIRTVGPRGGVRVKIEMWRVNGMVRTWKTRPEDFEVPIKYGLRNCDYLRHFDAGLFHLAQECPLLEAKAGDSTRPWR